MVRHLTTPIDWTIMLWSIVFNDKHLRWDFRIPLIQTDSKIPPKMLISEVGSQLVRFVNSALVYVLGKKMENKPCQTEREKDLLSLPPRNR